MNRHLATIIHDLLRCQVKTAERQGLDTITITVPRAKELIRLIREDNKSETERAHANPRLDAIMRRVERAALADYRGGRLEARA